MCGISGVFDPESPPNREILERMNDCIAHRGPDDASTLVSGPVGLAHRRLSIIDLETGDQPIYNEDGSVTVIFNGEIYNYRELRDSLVDAGHEFSTGTDTEVLVHLYEEEGADLVDRLEGMFAFALWDDAAERLVLARDRMGIKPLVVLEDDGRYAFASEVSALLQTDLDHGGLDREGVGQFFAFGHIPAPFTAFENVSKLRPGERAVITAEGIERDRFYELHPEPVTDGFEEAAATLRERVVLAVQKRLQSDVPLGAFLSGGIDSSVIVGVMSELTDEPVRTFTVGFDRDRFDESWAAREVADYHDTDHHEFTMSANDLQELVPEVLDGLGEPFGDPSLVPSYVVARETRRHVKVALSGDGADELFAGYDKYLVDFYSRYYRALPEAVRERVCEPLLNALPSSREDRLSELLYQAQWFVNRGGEPSVPGRHFEFMRVPTEERTEAFRSLSPFEVGRRELRRQHGRRSTDADGSLARIQAVDTRYSLPNQMLTKVDTASMYNSLEVRVPFLDTSVVEYALGLPTEYKITHRSRKRVLKEAFEDVLPESILNRDKQGFDMPVGTWFRHELREEFEALVSEVDDPFIDDEEVVDVFEEHCAERRDHSRFLWLVFVYKHWIRELQNGETTSEPVPQPSIR